MHSDPVLGNDLFWVMPIGTNEQLPITEDPLFPSSCWFLGVASDCSLLVELLSSNVDLDELAVLTDSDFAGEKVPGTETVLASVK